MVSVACEASMAVVHWGLKGVNGRAWCLWFQAKMWVRVRLSTTWDGLVTLGARDLPGCDQMCWPRWWVGAVLQ
jgi:hypothetical protein